MKILMLNTAFSRGGAAQIARMLHQALKESSEFSSYFAYGRGPKADNEKALRYAWQPEIYFHAFLTRATSLQGYGTWFSTRRLVKFIIKEDFDLIHLHNLHGYYLDLSFVRSLGKLYIPVVWTLHDGWALTGRCAYWFECDRWKKGCGHCPDLSRYPKTYLDTSALMWRKKKHYFAQGWNPIIVTPSRWLADKVRESYLSQYRVEVIPNGIDTKEFKPKDNGAVRERLGIPSSKKVVVFTAADLGDERKGARYFFESLQHIRADDWIVLTLGKQVDLKGNLGKAVDINQLGYVDDREMLAQVYSAADVFCISSLDDNFPTTVLESLACGTPVVGFKVGGIPEQVTEDCGILVDPREAKALGRAMEQLLRDDKMRQEMSLNCRKRAEQEYNVQRFTDRYIQVYREALAIES